MPSPAVQASVASVAQTAVRAVGPAVASLSDDGRGEARSRERIGADASRQARQVPPSERNEAAWREARRPRSDQFPSYWPTAAYFTQHLSQEALPDDRPPLDPGAGAARYPSLAFEADIILPNGASASRSAAVRRVDILV